MQLCLFDRIWLQRCWISWSALDGIVNWWNTVCQMLRLLWIHWHISTLCFLRPGWQTTSASWLVASPVNPWKLCSCELCYSWRDVGAESSEIFLSAKKKSLRWDAFLSERLWGSTIQIIWSLFSCGSVDVMPSSVPETSCKLSLHCLERNGRIFLYGQPVVWHFKHPFSKVWKIESSHRNNFPGESEL